MEYQPWKVKLTALAPLMVGAHRVLENHFESLDYIPANVLQAAFARAILESHENYDLEGQERRYFIETDRPDLPVQGCKPVWRNWFLHFNSIYFNDATPMGSHRYTPTTYRCKAYEEHPLKESLVDRYIKKDDMEVPLSEFKCNVCVNMGKEGRLERKDGWNLPPKIKISRRLVTRIEIDEKRLVGRDSKLYTMAILEPYANKEERIPLCFEGFIYAPEELDLAVDKEILFVGGYVTTGFGKMRVTVCRTEPEREDEIIQKIKAWNEKTGKESVAIQFVTDVIAPDLQKWVDGSTEEHLYLDIEDYLRLYTQWLQEDSNLPLDCEVDFTYLQQFQKRGFVPGKHQRIDKMISYISNGSVFVLKGKYESLIPWVVRAVQTGMPINSKYGQFRVPIKVISGQI